MNDNLYEMIFKRKSFHLFRERSNEIITEEEIKEIEEYFNKLIPLIDDIKIKLVIDKDKNTCRRNQEYCILFYSEKKDNYLQNIGYIGEQLDLYLVSKNIGTLWFGIGEAEEKELDGLSYVIMMAIAKIPQDKFRKDMFTAKRKELNEIWNGKKYEEIANIARFSPSACNTQPWKVEEKDNKLIVYRYRKEGKRGIMPKDKITYYNQIDIGIFLLILELCLNHNKIKYKRNIFTEEDIDNEINKIAEYKIVGG